MTGRLTSMVETVYTGVVAMALALLAWGAVLGAVRLFRSQG
ncbi:MAG: hypothetical protein PHU75_03990 [Candidatus Nanopelagicales bacterium]|nr:hypothetical protein [Candidatus Nanopelagicales bacterium]